MCVSVSVCVCVLHAFERDSVPGNSSAPFLTSKTEQHLCFIRVHNTVKPALYYIPCAPTTDSNEKYVRSGPLLFPPFFRDCVMFDIRTVKYGKYHLALCPLLSPLTILTFLMFLWLLMSTNLSLLRESGYCIADICLCSGRQVKGDLRRKEILQGI